MKRMKFVTINTALFVTSGNTKTEAIEIDSNLLSVHIIGSNIDVPDVLISIYGGHTEDVSKMGILTKSDGGTDIIYNVGNDNYIHVVDTAFSKYIAFGINVAGAQTGEIIIQVSYKSGIHSLPTTYNYLIADHNDLNNLNVGNYMHLTAAEYASFISGSSHTHSNKTILDGITSAFTTGLKSLYDTASNWIINNGNNVLNHLTNFTNPHNVTKSQIGLSNVDNVQQIPMSLKGTASGVAELDSGGKVPLSQINDVILGQVEFQGMWNATTDTPTLPDPTTVKGDYYIVSVDGVYATISFLVGDWVISDGISWGKVDNTDAVTSVHGRIGNVSSQNNDYTWGQINKTISDIADITTKSHTSLTDIGVKTHAEIDAFITDPLFKVHFNFIDVEIAEYRAPEKFKINTVTDPDVTGYTIKVNAVAYILGDTIQYLDYVEIEVTAIGLLILNCEIVP